MTVADDYSFAPFLDAIGSDFFADDPDLQAILAHHGLTGDDELKRIASYGKFAASSASEGADATDRPGNLPRLTPYDAFGKPHPVGVEVPQATRRVLAAALRAGVASESNAVLRYGMAYLGSQVGEAGVTCPLACTDGMVRALQELSGGPECEAALAHLLMQAPGGPVHAAQFVTEVQGGSDAGTNAVTALPQGDGSYRLHGRKWFCSNPWAQYWAVTARPEGAPAGPRGVALFLVPREDPVGVNNHFRLDRLKDKLGTRSLPTAEMTLAGSRAFPLGEPGQGLSNMVRIVLTTSRFWNALAAAGQLRSAERIVHAYADFREAFGQPIASFPLVAHSLDSLTFDRQHMTAAAFEVLHAWEQVASVERAGSTPDANEAVRLRILVMLAKTCATRRSTERIHEAMMILGGNGIEERFSALPRLWRDAAILETWEGPHGLLLNRSMMEMIKFGARDDARAMTRLLLGRLADSDLDSVEDLGVQLEFALSIDDDQTQAVLFRDWASDFYDRLGAMAWGAVPTS